MGLAIFNCTLRLSEYFMKSYLPHRYRLTYWPFFKPNLWTRPLTFDGLVIGTHNSEKFNVKSKKNMRFTSIQTVVNAAMAYTIIRACGRKVVVAACPTALPDHGPIRMRIAHAPGPHPMRITKPPNPNAIDQQSNLSRLSISEWIYLSDDQESGPELCTLSMDRGIIEKRESHWCSLSAASSVNGAERWWQIHPSG